MGLLSWDLTTREIRSIFGISGKNGPITSPCGLSLSGLLIWIFSLSSISRLKSYFRASITEKLVDTELFKPEMMSKVFEIYKKTPISECILALFPLLDLRQDKLMQIRAQDHGQRAVMFYCEGEHNSNQTTNDGTPNNSHQTPKNNKKEDCKISTHSDEISKQESNPSKSSKGIKTDADQPKTNRSKATTKFTKEGSTEDFAQKPQHRRGHDEVYYELKVPNNKPSSNNQKKASNSGSNQDQFGGHHRNYGQQSDHKSSGNNQRGGNNNQYSQNHHGHQDHGDHGYQNSYQQEGHHSHHNYQGSSSQSSGHLYGQTNNANLHNPNNAHYKYGSRGQTNQGNKHHKR